MILRASLPSRWLRAGMASLTGSVVVFMLVGCQRGTNRAKSLDRVESKSVSKTAVEALLDVPQPNLDIIAIEVRKQIEMQQAKVEQLREKPDLPTRQLATTYGNLGMLYHTYRMFDAAEICYQNAHQLAPDTYRWPHYLGYLRRTQKDPKKAIDAFEQAIKLRPESASALTYLGELCLETNQNDRAAEFFKRALAAEPSSAAALVGLGKIAMARRDYSPAVVDFERALKLQPDANVIHYSLAMAYRGLGNTDQAKAHLKQRGEDNAWIPDPLLAELPRLRVGARFHEKRGLEAGRSGQLAAAIRELRRAVKEDPNVVTTRVNLGTALTLSGELDAATEQYREAIRLKPDFAQAHFNLGVVLSQQGKDAEALESLRKAVQLDPQDFKAHLGLAEYLSKHDDSRGAAEQYALAVHIDPRHQAARLAEATSLVKAGDYAAARTRLEEARQVLPQSMILAHGLARLLAAAPDDQVRDGKRALPLALAVFQTRKSIQHAATVAMAYAETGQFDQAIQWQQQAVGLAAQSGKTDLLPWLRDNLARYTNSQACRAAWPPEA